MNPDIRKGTSGLLASSNSSSRKSKFLSSTQSTESVYVPIHPYLTEERKKESLQKVLKYIRSASNYSLYCIQEALNQDVVLCTYDPMVWLPPELLEKFISMLDAQSCLHLTCVNQLWKRYLSSHKIWRGMCKKYGFSDDLCEKLGCPLKQASHPSWMRVIRTAVALSHKFCNAHKFYCKEIVPVQKVTRQNEQEDFGIHVRNGLMCAYGDESFFVYDLTASEEVNRHKTGSKVSCWRFVDSRKNDLLHNEGIILYGTVTGELTAAIRLIGRSGYTYVSYGFHTSSVKACDADAELNLVVSSANEGFIRGWNLITPVALFTILTDRNVLYLNLMPKYEKEISIICEHNNTSSKITWSLDIKNVEALRDSITRLNSAFVDISGTQSNVERFGDFVNFTSCSVSDNPYLKLITVHKDNDTLGFIEVDPGEKHNNIVVHDAHTLEVIRSVHTRLKVRRLLATGRQFAFFTTTSWHELESPKPPLYTDEALVLFDLKSGQNLSFFVMPICKPVQSRLYECVSHDSAWMDCWPVQAVLERAMDDDLNTDINDHETTSNDPQCAATSPAGESPSDDDVSSISLDALSSSSSYEDIQSFSTKTDLPSVDEKHVLPSVGVDASSLSVSGIALSPPVSGIALSPPVSGIALSPPVSGIALSAPVSSTALCSNIPLIYTPKPASPVLYVTKTNKEIQLVTWQLGVSKKVIKIKTKSD